MRSKLTSWIFIITAGFVVPTILSRALTSDARSSGNEALGQFAATLSLPMVLLGIVVGGTRYGSSRVDPEDSDQRQWFGTTFARQWNALMLTYAQREIGTLYWALTAFISVDFVFDSAMFQEMIAKPGSDAEWKAYFGMALFVVLSIALMWVRHVASPHLRLVRAYLEHKRRLQGKQSSIPSVADFRVSRWRNPCHRTGFKLATRLERCIFGIRRKLEPRDAVFVTYVYSKLASVLRRTGIEVTEGSTAVEDKFNLLVLACFTLVLTPNPLEAAKQAENLISDKSAPIERDRGRLHRIVISASSAIQQHWPAVKILGFVAAIMVLLATGRIWQMIEVFLK